MIRLEEKLLVNILYRPASELLKGIDINYINFEKLITLTSGHLMLPALYFNIQKKKASYLFPEDFIAYIRNIFEINKARNEILLSEAKELSELLFENNIKHIFLKGTALLLSNVFEDIGERMIGDIDFIIQHKDEEKTKNVLRKNKYTTIQAYHPFQIFKSTHIPRQVNENKTIALEPHFEFLRPRHRWIFNSKVLRNSFNEELKTIKTPSTSFLFDHCIYALQVRDRGFFIPCHSHRSIYDIYKLDCKNSLRINNIKKDIFIKHFFLNIDKFKIFNIPVTNTLLSSYFDKLFRFLTISLFTIPTIPKKCLKIIQLFFNNKFRVRIVNKIRYHFSNKTLLNIINRWLKP
jgi:hypothetical protein|tara:strand:- start:751 stop:1797 length:1047 start_codon:yes stop_codon:yes gene_type:complete